MKKPISKNFKNTLGKLLSKKKKVIIIWQLTECPKSLFIIDPLTIDDELSANWGPSKDNEMFIKEWKKKMKKKPFIDLFRVSSVYHILG